VGPWAATARRGDTLALTGPGGGYAPSPEVDWHLMVGDEAVIPAIAVSLEKINPGVPVFVVLEVGGPEDEQPLRSPGDLRPQWLHRTFAPGEDPDLQLQAVRALDLPEGRGQAFVHGEAEAALRVRRHLLQGRGIHRDDLSATGYWKLRRTDEQWRAEKRDWTPKPKPTTTHRRQSRVDRLVLTSKHNPTPAAQEKIWGKTVCPGPSLPIRAN
jgi:NADPH-dependent ferric siderophore reductase